MSYDQDQRRKTYGLEMLPFPGLTIDMRKPGFLALEALTRAVLVLGGDFAGERLSPTERIDAWGDLFTAFADSLVAWDLTDRGRAVPPTRDGVLSQDPQFLLELARTWYAIVVLDPMDSRREEIGEPEPIHESDERFTNDPDALSSDDEAWLESFQTTTLTPDPDPELETGGLITEFEMPETEHDVAPVPDGPRT